MRDAAPRARDDTRFKCILSLCKTEQCWSVVNGFCLNGLCGEVYIYIYSGVAASPLMAL